MSTVISVESLSKKYQIGLREKRHQTFREAVMEMVASPLKRFRELSGNGHAESEFWALRDVSFEVQEGEVLGIIGRNGAGKSTLLKILSRITEPTSGRAVIRGRVASLLEVGTGFHNELSGRENVYLNGAILGMGKSEIDRKFDEIVDFSGVEKFLDTSIKHFSSGMKVRLAFAVAAHLDPEILIIDEVLAVGDQEFQNKCMGKMHDVANAGRTVLFVSHNLPAVEALCSRAIMLKGGHLVQSGEPDDVIADYLRSAGTAESAEFDDDHPLKRACLIDADGQPTECVMLGQDLTLTLEFCTSSRLEDVNVAFYISNLLDTRVIACLSKHQSTATLTMEGPTTVTCRIHDIRLVPGQYTIDIHAGSRGTSLVEESRAITFEVLPRDIYGTGKLPKPKNCVVIPDASWSVCESVPTHDQVGAAK